MVIPFMATSRNSTASSSGRGVSENYIFNLLSAEGESHVTSGVNARIVEAFNEAVNALPCKVDKVEELLIVLRWGNPQTDTCEQLSSIFDMLSNIKSVWDVSANESFGNSCRVVLVASVKASILSKIFLYFFVFAR